PWSWPWPSRNSFAGGKSPLPDCRPALPGDHAMPAARKAERNQRRIDIDPQLVDRYVMELSAFGGVGTSGVSRTVYSPAWVAATDQYAAWCDEAGLRVHRDAVGNVWGVLEGSDKGKSIVSGSHIDSQTPGGRYDGALGAIAALIALKTLRERYGAPRQTLEAL